jgi:RNA polymerase sigma-70 factor (ECF subfamily)
VQSTPRPKGDLEQQRTVVDAFIAAARVGDFEGLMEVLDPDVTWRVHTARGLQVKQGATNVAARIQRAVHAKSTTRRVLVNGAPGIAAWSADGRLRAVMSCTVVEGRIVEMESVTDPERLASIDLRHIPA